jgi:lipoprotein-anchoring transpeptidase ErfK/SrfK
MESVMRRIALAAALAVVAATGSANAATNQQQFLPFPFFLIPAPQVTPVAVQPQMPEQRVAAVPAQPEQQQESPRSNREIVMFSGNYAPGTIVISTAERRLYYVLPNGKAVRYAVGVGREGFQWSGTEKITNKQEWPDWRPPEDMLRRRPDLPRYMAGGEGNPLGARALYLGGSIYRIHGSNEPDTIGKAVSSGCIRMLNADVVDLYDRVKVGTQVVVLR